MNKRSERAIVAIYEGLFSLLSKESFDKITVREICKESNVNKMTFYKYHKDKYDALSKSFQYLFSRDFHATFGDDEALLSGVNDEDRVYRAISYINSWCREHGLQIHNVFTTQDGLPYDIVKAAVLNDYKKFVSEFLDPAIFPVAYEYVATFVFAGYIGCIERYLQKLRAGVELEAAERELDTAAHFFAKGWVAVLRDYLKPAK
ncbi:MAG: TetR/AcrR family transcriptional regulator [Bacilli bacterium]|nr:TetR/AcrR family transcriptional regulator [Bacilli bacterium]